MNINYSRETLISTGEHVGAIRRLGETFSVDEYLFAVQAARDAGDGEVYARAVLGETVTAVADAEPDPTGADLHEAAVRILAARGKADTYSADDYLAACDEAVGQV